MQAPIYATMTAMHNRWYLAIDLGTGGAKVAAVGDDGSILASAFRAIDTALTADGGTEQDTIQWWSGIVDAAREVVLGAAQASA